MTTPSAASARASGVLMPVSSLPGRHGIGDLGQSARGFVERLAKAGQCHWQVLPLGPTGFGDSPYQCLSSFGGNTNLISLEDLQDFLPAGALEDAPKFRERRVDYGAVIAWHDEMLSLAFEGFVSRGGRKQPDFVAFCQRSQGWLDDFCLFVALKEAHDGRAWMDWPPGEALRAPVELAAARERHACRIDEHRFRQWIFDRQWRGLRQHARESGVRIIGDVPIYVAQDSADVWVHRDLFDLDPSGHPRVVAGVPPDYFSPSGQLWGNPLYLWSEHKRRGYDWWLTRVRAALDRYDVVRFDHFRALYDYWQIPAAARTAREGRWVDGPRDDFMRALAAAFAADGRDLASSIIAEDLGDAMTAVRAWRETWGLPGMKILQFAFGDNEEERARFRPEKFAGQNDDPAVMYVGTHDNNTVMGWWFCDLAEHNRERFLAFARQWRADPGLEVGELHWEIIRIGMESRERLFIVAMQDLLAAGTSSRTNRPGSAAGNWRWRCTGDELASVAWDRLAVLTHETGRRAGGGPRHGVVRA